MVFLLGPVVASRFSVHIDGFNVTINKFSVNFVLELG